MPDIPLPEATWEPPMPIARAEVSSFNQFAVEVATFVTTSGMSRNWPNEKEYKKTHLAKKSFLDWLTLSNVKPIDRSNELNTNNSNSSMINQFIQNKPKIGNSKILSEMENDNLNLHEQETLMTETLAKVFVKQKKFENALQAYQILSLKYPEKNSFFADQINEIKRLQKLKE